MNRNRRSKNPRYLNSSSSHGRYYTRAESDIHFLFALKVAGSEGWENTHKRYMEMKGICLELGISSCSFDELRSCYQKVYRARRGPRMLRRSDKAHGHGTPYVSDTSHPDLPRMLRSAQLNLRGGW
jgi:hypothetical protein